MPGVGWGAHGTVAQEEPPCMEAATGQRDTAETPGGDSALKPGLLGLEIHSPLQLFLYILEPGSQ